MCSFVLMSKNSVPSVSVVKYAQNRYGNEDYGPIFSVAEVFLNGIIAVAWCCSLSLSERNVPFPGEQHCFTCTCFTAPHVHVVLSHMCMSYSFTCTSKTTLHTEASYITLWDRALSMPKKEIDGSDWCYLAWNWLKDYGSLSSIRFPLRKSAFILSTNHRLAHLPVREALSDKPPE